MEVTHGALDVLTDFVDLFDYVARDNKVGQVDNLHDTFMIDRVVQGNSSYRCVASSER